MAITENGPTSNWGITLDGATASNKASDAVLQKLAPYLKLAKNCGQVNNGCWVQNGPYENLKGEIVYQIPSTSNASALLSNGVEILIYKKPQTTPQDSIGILDIQTNPRKKDIFGKTLFQFSLYPEEIIPVGITLLSMIILGKKNVTRSLPHTFLSFPSIFFLCVCGGRT